MADKFDHLVAGLSIDDRVSILQQMKSQIKPEIESLAGDEGKEDNAIQGSINLKNESIITRIILFFKSVFSNKRVDVVYTEHKLTMMAKKIESKFPGLFSAQNLSLESDFYEELLKLKEIAVFFKSGLSQYDEHQGSFLVMLGSLIMPDMERKIETAANPYAIPFSQEITTDLRPSMIRKLDAILADVSINDKSVLYTCVQSLIWLKSFVQLPFESFIIKFNEMPNGKVRCVAATALTELEKFSNVLCNAKKVETEVLEALYLFLMQSRMDAGEKIDVQAGVAAHMESSLASIKGISRFISKVPLRSITMVARRSVSWLPMYKDSGEDWFVQYKAQWKRIFDKKWSHWLHERKIALTKEQVTAFCNTSDYPLFPNRPWSTLSVHIPFSKEYSLGFLYTFFASVYMKYNEVLKIIMMDGDFVLRENKTEFIDTYTETGHLIQSIKDLNDKLSSKGSYGLTFSTITSDVLRTVQGQLQIQTLMTTIDSEVNLLVLNFGNVCRSFSSIFNGILVSNYNPNYDTISNIASLVGPDNAPIRKHIVEVSESIATALTLLQEIESIELKGTGNAK